MKLHKYFLSSRNPIDSTPIIFNNVASFSYHVRLCGISSTFGNQQHIEIVVLVINLIYFPNTKSAPLGFLEFGIDGLVLSPPLNVLGLEVKKKHSYDLTRKFQVEWAVKLPWVELQVDSNGCGKYVKCKFFFEVYHKDKLLALQWDSF
jgi:hypothetical protein